VFDAKTDLKLEGGTSMIIHAAPLGFDHVFELGGTRHG
jgi:hypothetical protein